jgi:hypothetical protein
MTEIDAIKVEPDRELLRAVSLAIYEVAHPASAFGDYAGFRRQLAEPDDYFGEARAAIAAVRKYDAEHRK